MSYIELAARVIVFCKCDVFTCTSFSFITSLCINITTVSTILEITPIIDSYWVLFYFVLFWGNGIVWCCKICFNGQGPHDKHLHGSHASWRWPCHLMQWWPEETSYLSSPLDLPLDILKSALSQSTLWGNLFLLFPHSVKWLLSSYSLMLCL